VQLLGARQAGQAAGPVAFIATVVLGWAAIIYGIWDLIAGHETGWAFALGGLFALLILLGTDGSDHRTAGH